MQRGVTLGEVLCLTLVGGCVVGGIVRAIGNAGLSMAIARRLETENPAAAAAIAAWNADIAARAAADKRI